MSQVLIMAALEARLAQVTPTLPTAHENVGFVPAPQTPYQRAALLPGEPVNPAYGDEMYREQGIFQVTLCFPAAGGTSPAGAGPARTQAELVRAAFPRGSSFTSGGVTVIVSRTASIGPAFNEADRFCIPVRVGYFAHIRAGP